MQFDGKLFIVRSNSGSVVQINGSSKVPRFREAVLVEIQNSSIGLLFINEILCQVKIVRNIPPMTNNTINRVPKT